MTTVATAAETSEFALLVRSYWERRFPMVFWARTPDPADDWKGPREQDWQNKEYGCSAYRVGMQVGVKTGTEIEQGRFLLDIDLDWQPGIRFAVSHFLPNTGFAFGRPSKRVGHAFFTTSRPIQHCAFKDIDGTMLVERRGTKSDGTIGKQTMMPPSIHRQSGEMLTLTCNGPITHDDTVVTRTTEYAIACMLGRHWPKNGPDTNQHDSAGYASAFLCRCGIEPGRVPVIIEVAATLGGDDNVKDRVHFARDTVAKWTKGNHRLGGRQRLAKELGEPVVERITDWIAVPNSESTDAIYIRGGQLSAIVDRAEDALLQSAQTSIFQRGGVLTRVVTLDHAIGDPSTNDVRRAAGATVLFAVREPWLVEQMGRIRQWKKVTAAGEHVFIDPPSLYARTLLTRGEWRFPVLRGVVTTPTLDRDGRIIERPGFDAASGLLVNIDPAKFPPVPVSPTRDDALAALKQLQHPLRKFPFVDEAAKSVALAAMLTALVRVNLKASPLHGFDAPVAGTGKSLLAEGVGLLATGVKPAALSQGKTSEEDEKRLSTVLFAGDPVIHLDNCERPITGDFLCSMLTQEVVQARILGLSERRILPSTALVLASGNNLTLSGDATRRAVICRMNAGVERPDTRAFDFDVHAEVRANRPALVIAGLTILRAYAIAGRPQAVTAMGSFADYDWIRGALVWLGCADPAESRERILKADPTRDELLSIMQLWETALGDTRVEVGEINKFTGEAVAALKARLIEVACRHDQWKGKSVGWWLRRHKERVIGERSFTCVDGAHGLLWSLNGAKPLDRELVSDAEIPF